MKKIMNLNLSKFLFIFLIGIFLPISCFDKKQEVTNETEQPTEKENVGYKEVVNPNELPDAVETPINEEVVEPKINEYGEEYDSFGSAYVIANEVNLRTEPNINASKASSLKFGQKVWQDYNFTESEYAKIYLTQPVEGQEYPTAYYAIGYTLVYDGEFNRYKKYFSLKPFAELHTKTKKLILDNSYKSQEHALTENATRAKDVICYGDFDGDKMQDVAVVLDNNETQSSRLLVFCNNAATQEPYMAYAENFSDKVKLNSFNKGAKIFMNSSNLVNSINDGIIVRSEDVKVALVYDKNSQKFKTYYQDEYAGTADETYDNIADAVAAPN